MLMNLVFLLAGLGILLFAGDTLVRGAASLATRLGISKLIISLTIVAFGTSAPELMVTIDAVRGGDYGIAMGNIIGSNIANILLVLGLPALIYPIATNVAGLRHHACVMLGATMFFSLVAYSYGVIDRLVGLVFLGSVVAYICFVLMRARNNKAEADTLREEASAFCNADSIWKTCAYLLIGLIGLPAGAHLMVENGVQLAALLGIRNELVGLTIIAFGTSLPELATVYAAARQRQADVAIGNIVGSNIFNILVVGGAAGLAGHSFFSTDAKLLDFPMMLGATILLALLIFQNRKITRRIGGGMFVLYLAYMALLAIKAGVV